MSRQAPEMEKSPQKQEAQKKIMLTFQQFQMVNETVFNESYLVIKNLSTGSSWESPKFYYKMFDLWCVQVDSFNLQLELYMKIKSKYPKVAYTTLQKGASTLYLEQLTNPGNKFCLVSYELEEIEEEPNEPKQKGKNSFQNNSNIFQTFLKNDDVFKVSQEQLSKKIQPKPTSDEERVAFHGDISIISHDERQSKKSAVKEQAEQGNENQNQQNQSSDQRKRFMHSFDDSVSFIQQFLKSFPEPDIEQNQKLNNTPVQESARKQKQELQNINQNPNQSQEEYKSTAQKWYSQKFNKKNVKYKKKNSGIGKNTDQKPLPNNAKAIEVTQFNTSFLEKQSTIRQMTDMSVEEQIRLKSIDFSLTSEGSVSRLYKLSRFDGNTSSLWYTAISLPNEGTVMVQCTSDEGELNGCLGSEELKKGSCPLYDDEGNIIGNFSFKCKSVCNYVVQTQECLQSNNQSIEVIPEKLSKPIQPEESKEKIAELESQLRIFPMPQQKQVEMQGLDKDKSKEDQKKIDQKIGLLQEQNKKKSQNIEKKYTDPKTEREVKVENAQPEPIVEVSSSQQKISEMNNPELTQSQVKKIQENKPKIIRAQVSQKMQALEETKASNQQFLKSGRKQSYREQKLEKPDVYQMTIENNKSQMPSDDLQGLKKTLRQSRLHRYEIATPNEEKKQNYSFTSPTTIPGASIKLDTIDSKYGSDYPLQVEHADNKNGRSSNVEKNYLSHRPPKYNQRANESYDQRHESASHHYDNSRDYSERNQNQSIISSSLLGKHRIDFKIENIQLFLVRANYNGKLLKMQIEKNIFHTETSDGLYILSWEGRGYFFRNVSEYALLHIDFIEQCQGIQMATGKCKIPLPQLNTHRVNEVFDVDDFVRDDNEEQIGRIKISYKIIDRNQRNYRNKSEQRKSSSISKALDYIQNGNLYLPRQSSVNPPKKKKVKTHRMSTEISSRVNDSYERDLQSRRFSYLWNDEQNYSVFSRFKNKSPLTKRKYTGGNTLIPKASRFVEQNMTKKLNKNDPGPGQYEVPSMFDRHATPL